MSKTVRLPDGRETTVSYRPGRLKVDTEKSVWMMSQVPAEFGVTFLPAVLLIDHLRGRNANVCADACLALKGVYGLLGIDARITPVSVVVEPPTGGVSVYGQNPRWDGKTFVGHCVLWLPGLGRLVDPTIQQFPELASQDGPFVGRVGAASQAMPAELPVGTSVPIVRDGAQVVYQVVGDEALITDSEPAAHAAALNPKSAASLAGWALSIMAVPEIASRVRSAPFPRIHALIDAIDGAPVDAGPAGYRFMLPGADGQLTPTWVDDIPVE
ncbi:MAG: hypothetical protein V7603_5189 [Micromonosporaceae bacterium]